MNARQSTAAPLSNAQVFNLLPDLQVGWTLATYGLWVARAIERAHGISAAGGTADAAPAAPEPSGETIEQREEVCAAWHELPDDLRKDQRLTRLYHALGGPRMDAPQAAGGGAAPAEEVPS